MQSGSFAPYRYTYWSQRAIDDLVGDTVSRSRPAVKSIELGLPIIGLKLSLEQAAARSGRHAVATEIEIRFSEHVHVDPATLSEVGNALMAGSGTVYATAWGSNEGGPTGTGRVTLFSDLQVNGTRVAVCLFGSMGNFDMSIQDIHPENVRGVANSAALDVLSWIEENKEFPGRWGEPVGMVAYKIASPYREMPLPSSNYARVALMEQKYTEWLAHIYESYRIEPGGILSEIPFDLILVGRPVWVRARYLAVNPGEGVEGRKLDESYSKYWKKMLRLKSDDKGWPVHLYRILLARKGVKVDI
ncbi:hypothetical protein [Amycolatopsis sp. NBC_00438]|uniref:hypothetical protein n=1 Tax=Amycolatopsis sp. NBC_00438 TaxID=2903558 RepID=UPI002E211871